MDNRIYHLSWGETSFLAKLKLFVRSRKEEGKKIQSHNPQTRAEGYSALSSTYYSIAQTGVAQFLAIFKPVEFGMYWPLIVSVRVVRFVAWCITWFPLSFWCHWRMLLLSNRVVALIGYDGMSADQCDIRQSILRRYDQYEEAEKCIRAALIKWPEKAHTRGLLHVGLADVFLYRGNQRGVKDEMITAAFLAKDAAEQDPRQAARIYRHCANFADWLGELSFGDKLRCLARELAQATNAKDQLFKM